ncbi:hypothetical protein [Microbacterium sp. R86528]|uniref:hypothetical protein n=1 Tax=Microbacterium sp. R86528 TaxID=3093864 RepID=UPI0037C9B9B0
MDATQVLTERVSADHAAVERVAWRWATRLRTAGEKCGSAEALALADTFESALAADGADGVLDLALAGPALGGLGCNDLAALVRGHDLV